MYSLTQNDKNMAILKKAKDLVSQDKEISFEDKQILVKVEELKTMPLKLSEYPKEYLQYLQKRIADDSLSDKIKAVRLKALNEVRLQNLDKTRRSAATPEEKEAKRLKRLEQSRYCRKKRESAATPEETEAMRIKLLEKVRQYRHEKREKQESILKKAMDQNEEMSFEDKEILRKVEEKKAKLSEAYQKRKAAATPEEKEAIRLKSSNDYRRRQEKLKEMEKSEFEKMKQLRNNYYKNKRVNKAAITNRAKEILSQNEGNKEISLEEKEILRKAQNIEAARLRKNDCVNRINKNRKSTATPEELEAIRVIERARNMRCNKKRKESEHLRLRRAGYLRQSRQQTPEKKEPILKKSTELLCQNKEKISLDEREILGKAENTKALPLKCREYTKQYSQKLKIASTSEKTKTMPLKRLDQIRHSPQKRKNAATPEKVEARRLKNLEYCRMYRQQIREKTENSILKKAMELLSQNKELSLEENDIVKKGEEIKAKRMGMSECSDQYLKEQQIAEKEARRLKKSEQLKRYRQKRIAAATPEDLEAMRLRLRKYERSRKEKQDLILKTALELLSQKQEISSEGLEILKSADKIKAYRLKQTERLRIYQQRRNKNFTPEQREEERLKKRRQYRNRKKQKQIKAFGQEKFNMKNVAGWLKKDQVLDEIKIEKEVLQETTIKAISVRQNANSTLDIQQEGFIDSSCSWIQLSEKSYMTEGTSKSPRYFQSFPGGSYSIQKSFPTRHSTKLVWKKSGLEESFRCMRVLIDATAKRDTHVVFGREIAQKLRTSKKDEAEVNIAKLLIDNILQNLITGVYNSEKIIA